VLDAAIVGSAQVEHYEIARTAPCHGHRRLLRARRERPRNCRPAEKRDELAAL
jgi:hypothetical protein